MISVGIPETIHNKPVPGEWLRLVQQTADSFAPRQTEEGMPVVGFAEVCDPDTNQRTDGFALVFYEVNCTGEFCEKFYHKVDEYCTRTPEKVAIGLKSMSIVLIQAVYDSIDAGIAAGVIEVRPEGL